MPTVLTDVFPWYAAKVRKPNLSQRWDWKSTNNHALMSHWTPGSAPTSATVAEPEVKQTQLPWLTSSLPNLYYGVFVFLLCSLFFSFNLTDIFSGSASTFRNEAAYYQGKKKLEAFSFKFLFLSLEQST